MTQAPRFQNCTDAKQWLIYQLHHNSGAVVVQTERTIVAVVRGVQWIAVAQSTNRLTWKTVIGDREDVLVWAAVELSVGHRRTE